MASKWSAEGRVYRDSDGGASRIEAAKHFYACHGEWPDTVTEEVAEGEEVIHEVVDVCEGCGDPLFVGDWYRRDSEGITWHAGDCPGDPQP